MEQEPNKLEEFTNQMKLTISVLSSEEEDPTSSLDFVEEWIKESVEFGRSYYGEKSSEESSTENEEEEQTKEQVVHFLKRALPKIVSTLLDRKFTNKILRLRVNTFLQKVLQMCAAYLDIRDFEEVGRYASKILDDNNKFYSENTQTSSWDQELEIDGPFAKMPNVEWKLRPSTFLIFNLNHFGKSKGFDLMLSRFKEAEPIDIEYLNIWIKPVARNVRYFRKDWLKPWIEDVKLSVFKTLKESSDQDLKELPKKEISYIYDVLEHILCFVSDSLAVGESLEKFRLEFSLKCLNMDNFEKRLFGISEIKDLIDMTFNKDIKLPPNSKEKAPPKTKWLNPEYIAKWIIQHSILEKFIFGNSLHDEMVKRVVNIYRLLCRIGLLKFKHIDMLWESSIGKPDIMVDAIYKVLKQASFWFSDEEIDYVFEKLQKLPLSSLSKRELKVIRKLIIHSSSDFTKKKDCLGLKILWNLALEDKLEPELKSTAMTFLLEMLEQSRLFPLREKYIELCIQNLGEFRCVSSSLFILKQILTSYDVKGNKTVGTVVVGLDQKYKLLELFFKEFAVFSTSTKPSEPDTVEQLLNRLKFLNYILHNSSLALTLSQVESLWDTLVAKSVPVLESHGLEWFQAAAESPQLFDDPEKICKFLLNDKIAAMDVVTWSFPLFKCFKSLFTTVNVGQHKLEVEGSHSFRVLDIALEGLPVAWKVALNVLSPHVTRPSMDFLIELYGRLSPALTLSQAKINHDFIAHVIDQLSACQHDNAKVERSLLLLQLFVESYEKSRQFQRSKNDPKLMHVTFSPAQGYLDQHFLTVSASASVTVGDLLTQFSKFMVQEPSSIQLWLDGKPLDDLSVPVKDLQVEEGSIVNYHVTSDTPSPVTPSQILSFHQHFFETIFSLLDSKVLNLDIKQQVWNLLVKLPVNPKIQNDIHMISEDENRWAYLAKESSPYRLLYTLRLLENASSIKSSENKLEKDWKTPWTQRFTASNGLSVLLKLFLEKDDMVKHSATCDALLGILNKYLIGQVQQVAKGAAVHVLNDASAAHVDLLSLLKRLLWTCSYYFSALSVPGTTPVEISSERAVQKTLLLMTAILTSKQELAPKYFEMMAPLDLWEKAVITCRSSLVRQFASWTVRRLCDVLMTSGLKPGQYFFDMFQGMLSRVSGVPGATTAEYFKLFNHLLESGTGKLEVSMEKLFDQVVHLINEHPLFEISENSPEDHTLIGLVNLLCTFIRLEPAMKKNQTDTVQKLWSCLFDLPSRARHGVNAPPKCKSKTARKATFDLLLEFSKGTPANYDQLVDLVRKHHIGYPRDVFNYDPKTKQRSVLGYSGLKNLGCTCYMNSLLQQLYMIPRFRKGILSIDIPSEDHKDNYFFEFQAIFAYLQETLRKYYNPYPFAETNKDYEGNTMDVTQQMDVDEYFNMMCEKLEGFLKEKSQKSLLSNIWAGKLTSQLICRGCPHRRDRDDPFFTISLDIKKKANILEALELYVKGEWLEQDNAYLCEKCNVKRDTLKRSCIRNLPNTLILNLKRFEFNFDTMRKVKLNDYCEFPMELDMFPYTSVGLYQKEKDAPKPDTTAATTTTTNNNNSKAEDAMEVTGGDSGKVDDEELQRISLMEKLLKERPKSYYEYQLKGIIVHRGSSESGHYYSFIQERTPSHNSAEPQWIEFNDKIVRPFSIKDLADNCFGGTEEVMLFDEKSKTEKKRTVEKSRNAYMLIYERNHFLSPDSDPSSSPTPPAPAPVQNKKKVNGFSVMSHVMVFAGRLLHRMKSRKQHDIIKVSMPDYLYDKVWADNQFFALEKVTFDGEYFKWILELLKQHQPVPNTDYDFDPASSGDNTLAMIQFASIFFIEVMSRAKDTSAMVPFVEHMSTLFSQHTRASVWFLQELIKLDNLLREMLFENTNSVNRKAFADLLLAAVKNVLSHEDEYYLYFQPPNEEDMDPDNPASNSMEVEGGPCKFLIARIMYKMANRMAYDEWKWTYLDELFYFFFQAAQLSEETLTFLVTNRFMSVFHNSFMTDELYNAKKLFKRTRSKRKGDTVGFHYYISLLSYFSNQHKHVPEGGPPILEDEDLKAIFDKMSLYKMIKNGYNSSELLNFAALWVVDDVDMTMLFLEATLVAIKESEYDALKPAFEIFQGLLKIQDSLTAKRMTIGMEKYVAIMEEKKKLPKKTRECVTFLFDLGKDNELAKKWLMNNKEKYSWVPTWLKDNPIRK